jgi:hypothetical protein
MELQMRFLSLGLAGTICLCLALPVSAQVLTEGFDSGLPGGSNNQSTLTSIPLSSGNWFAINQSSPIGVNGVFQGNLTVFTQHSGTGYAGINFNSGAGTSNLSTYLMSPVLSIKEGDTVSFFSRTATSSSFPDRLRLRMSLNGASTSTADFSTVLLTINDGLTTTGYPDNWTQFTAVVPNIGGTFDGRFAFHYDVPNGGPNGANSDYIGIDTFVFVPEPGLAGVAIIGAIGLIRARRKLC